MAEFQTANAYAVVTLVDRAMQGGYEIVHDGIRVVFKQGEIEKAVPQFFAEWVFQTDKERVHTTDGGFVPRFGLKDPPDELIQSLGPECANCDPIEIDDSRVERWDTASYAPERGKTRTIALARRPDDYANLAADAVTFGKER